MGHNPANSRVIDKVPVGRAPAGSHFLSPSASAGHLYLLDGSRLVALSFAAETDLSAGRRRGRGRREAGALLCGC